MESADGKKRKILRESIITAGTHFATRWCGFFSGFSKKVKIEFNDGRFSNPFLFSSLPGPWVYGLD
jgi:hypothetical protein